MNAPIDYEVEFLKVPPFSLESEQSVLGGLMVAAGSFERVEDILTSDDFFRLEHRLIFASIAKLAGDNQPYDFVTVDGVLNASCDYARAGGFAYLAEMARLVPSASNIRAYANAVKERSNLRALIRIGGDISDSVFNADGRKSIDLIEQAQISVMSLGESIAFDDITTNQALRDVVCQIDELYNSESDITGLKTGLCDIDKRTCGLQPSDLIVIAGRPSMGKTAFSMNIVENVVLNGGRVLVFSMEMSRAQLLKRCIASIGKIHLKKVMTGKLDDEDWPRLSTAVSRIKDRGLIIDDRAALSIIQMRSAARKLHKQAPLSLVVVDYIQLATSKADSREQEVSAITRGLKSLAKELNIPVIALSQLNRKVEDRGIADRRPRNSDLRDSGGIEQDADLIGMLYRDEVYRPEDTERKGIAEIEWTKFRNGEIGTDFLACNLHMARFDSLRYEDRPRPETKIVQKKSYSRQSLDA